MVSEVEIQGVEVSCSPFIEEPEEVRETVETEKRCPRCRGTGSVVVRGQETDCLDCEGFGSILI